MQLDIHVPRFTWPGGPGAIGPTFDVTGADGGGNRGAHAVGDGPLVPDGHDVAGRGADARGLHRALLRRGQDGAPAIPAPRRRSHVPPPRSARQDGHHPGRAVGRTGRARPRCRLVRARAPGPRGALPAVCANATRGSRRRSRSASRCGATTTAPTRAPTISWPRRCVRPNRSARRGRGCSSAAAASARRSGSSRSTRTRATSSATPTTVAHKVEVLRRHCDDVGRDPSEIEVTALIGVPEDADRDTILREVEAMAAAGTQAIVVRSTGSEPSKWLEETWGPLVPALAGVG